ncbi:MAG: winged helix-turn-helix domain-containing protein [Desulfurococcaceae archaeon]
MQYIQRIKRGEILRNEYERLMEMLIENPRVSFKKLAEESGLSYALIRKRLKSLVNKGLLMFKLCTTPAFAGREVAVIRIKSNEVGKIIELAGSCNRVLTSARINEHEGVLLMSGTSKTYIALRIDSLKSCITSPVEISIEYGVLPENQVIVIKRHNHGCHLNLRCDDCTAKFASKILGKL